MPYVQQLMILILKSTQNRGVTTECKGEKERFGKGSLGADLGVASPPVEPSLSSERRKTADAMEGLSVPLSRLLYSRF
jgi:hypothetical protein